MPYGVFAQGSNGMSEVSGTFCCGYWRRAFVVAVCRSRPIEQDTNPASQQNVAMSLKLPRAAEIEAPDGRKLLVLPENPALDAAVACMPSKERVHDKTLRSRGAHVLAALTNVSYHVSHRYIFYDVRRRLDDFVRAGF